jgi:hypothetical protein
LPNPGIILDAQAKSTRYDGDRFSRANEKACIGQTDASALRRGCELRLQLGNGAAKTYRDAPGCDKEPGRCKNYLLYDYFPENRLFLINRLLRKPGVVSVPTKTLLHRSDSVGGNSAKAPFAHPYTSRTVAAFA